MRLSARQVVAKSSPSDGQKQQSKVFGIRCDIWSRQKGFRLLQLWLVRLVRLGHITTLSSVKALDSLYMIVCLYIIDYNRLYILVYVFHIYDSLWWFWCTDFTLGFWTAPWARATSCQDVVSAALWCTRKHWMKPALSAKWTNVDQHDQRTNMNQTDPNLHVFSAHFDSKWSKCIQPVLMQILQLRIVIRMWPC